MALTDEGGSGSIPATMLVGPANLGGAAAPAMYPYPVYGAPMMGGNGGGMGGFGQDGSWIILLIIVLLAAGGGWGGNRSGGGGIGGGAPIIVNSDGGSGHGAGYAVQRGFDQAAVMSGITGVQSGIYNLSTQMCDGFGNVQQTLCNGFAGVNSTVNGAQNAIAQQLYANQIADLERSFAAQTASAQGMTALQSQFAQCCCDQRLATEGLRATILQENCQDRNEAQQNTRDIIESQTRSTQAILDKLCQLELDGVKQNYENRIAGMQNALDQARSDNQGLRFAASQNAQTAAIQAGQRALANEVEQYVNPLPIPSYNVPNPFCCQSDGCGRCGGNF